MKSIVREANRFRFLFLIIVLLSIASPAFADYLKFIKQDRLPKEALEMFSQLQEIEPYVKEWQTTWSYDLSKEKVKARVKNLSEKYEKLLAKYPENGELFLLSGLIAFYGHNVDLDDFSKKADICFNSAQKLLADDYRPLWFLGMHLSKSTRTAEGMRTLLKAEGKQNILEALFWEDYALASYTTAMFGHVNKGFNKFRELTGRRSRMEDIIGGPMRAAAKTPKAGEKLERQFFWRSIKSETALTIVSFPLGYKFSLKNKDNQDFGIKEFDGRFAALQIGLTPQMSASGAKLIPTFHIATFIADERESLESFAKKFMSKSATWQRHPLGLGLNEICYLGQSPEHYSADGGAKVIFIAFERNNPKMSRIALEEPEEELRDKNSGFYRVANYYQRFEGRLFYLIMLETPARFFDQSFTEFKDILTTLIVE